MNFISYTDEFGLAHIFDAARVMFTMSQPTGDMDEDGNFTKILTKVALNENMGFIIADEEPASMIARIKEANGDG
tara:strand:+ start:416 stop:640 length:225 start_codon:yes stop_codon:yes gene_type:complete